MAFDGILGQRRRTGPSGAQTRIAGFVRPAPGPTRMIIGAPDTIKQKRWRKNNKVVLELPQRSMNQTGAPLFDDGEIDPEPHRPGSPPRHSCHSMVHCRSLFIWRIRRITEKNLEK
jgi:hypothetical protein